jgi:hypothetical protein
MKDMRREKRDKKRAKLGWGEYANEAEEIREVSYLKYFNLERGAIRTV